MSDKSSTDSVARFIGVGGLAVATIGLVIAYYGLREQQSLSKWQKSVQEEGLKERLQDNVCLIGTFATAPFESAPTHGEVQIEIVNMGQTKSFVQRVELRAADFSLTAQPINHKTKAWELEPGMTANFEVTGWDFSKHPLSWKKNEEEWEPYTVLVTTSRMTHQLEGHTNQFEISSPVRFDEWTVDDPVWSRSTPPHRNKAH